MDTFQGGLSRLEGQIEGLPPPLLEMTDAAREYTALPSLQQAHMLDGEKLVVYHHSLRRQITMPHIAKVGHLLAGAWCQVELAHIRDFEGQHAEAQELLALASSQTSVCQTALQNTRYLNRPIDRYEYYYRTKLLATYIPHFQQLGPVHWPSHPTSFQRDAYASVQKSMLNPLLRDFTIASKENNAQLIPIIAGLIGEVTVLQVLNRIQRTHTYSEWSVAPASVRENNTIETNTARRVFDLKFTFPDQTQIPIEVKWRKTDHEYDPSIAVVVVNQERVSGLKVANAMRREVNGGTVLPQDMDQLDNMTENVLGEMERVGPSGESIYKQDSLETAAAWLALGALVGNFREQKTAAIA